LTIVLEEPTVFSQSEMTKSASLHWSVVWWNWTIIEHWIYVLKKCTPLSSCS